MFVHIRLVSEWVRMTYIVSLGGSIKLEEYLASLDNEKRAAYVANLSRTIEQETRDYIAQELQTGPAPALPYLFGLAPGWRTVGDARFSGLSLVSRREVLPPPHRAALFKSKGMVDSTSWQEQSRYSVDDEIYNTSITVTTAYTASYSSGFVYADVVDRLGRQSGMECLFKVESVSIIRSWVQVSCPGTPPFPSPSAENAGWEMAWGLRDQAVEYHKSLEYWLFLNRGYEPAAKIIDSWMSIAGLPPRSELQIDRDLAAGDRVWDPTPDMTLSLNLTAFRTGDPLRVGLRARNSASAFSADFYFGVVLPDGVTSLFLTRLSPLDGVMTTLDGGAHTFPPLFDNVQLSQGLDITLADFFVYPFTGGEPPGTYTVFAALVPRGAFNDGRVDPADLLVIDTRLFSFSR